MRIARARYLCLSEVMSAIWVLEYLLVNSSSVGFPCTCLCAISHDLPWSAVVLSSENCRPDVFIDGGFWKKM